MSLLKWITGGNAKEPPQEGPSFRIRDLQSGSTKIVIFRTDREEEWLKHNPLLLHREFGYVIDTDEVVVGNGHSRFANLPRLTPGLAGVVMFSVTDNYHKPDTH